MEENEQSGNSVIIVDATDEDDLRELSQAISQIKTESGDILGIQIGPFHIKYVLDVAKEYNLFYYWNIVILRNFSYYSEDFVFDGCYDCLLIFHTDFIKVPNRKIKDHFCSIEQAENALQALVTK
mgnify:CR=1 FL=1